MVIYYKTPKILVSDHCEHYVIDHCFSARISVHTAVFVFSQLFFLEEKRRQCLEDLATLIQKIYRGWKCRTHFQLLKKSQVVVAAWYRRYAVG